MPLPPLPPLQFLVLQVIGASERRGRDIREGMAYQGARKSLPAFYQLMSRLEEAGFVKGSYHTLEIGDQTVKERWYKLTGSGIRAYNATSSFYNSPLTTRGVVHA